MGYAQGKEESQTVYMSSLMGKPTYPETVNYYDALGGDDKVYGTQYADVIIGGYGNDTGGTYYSLPG